MVELLDTITKLSHEFGQPEYVKGGGGNTSVKDGDRLWVKPSGVSLAEIRADQFVELSRSRLDALYEARLPESSSEREAAVKALMMAAVAPGSTGRPSVEAPLHSALAGRYVVHTHPALVNGLTCAVGGREAAAMVIPDAMWVEYIDPGYTLCVHIRRVLLEHAARGGVSPRSLVLQNHGIFVAGDTAGEIQAIYAEMLTRLRDGYRDAGVETELDVGPMPSAARQAELKACVAEAMGDAWPGHAAVSGPFALFSGPLSPDHLVYVGAYGYVGEPTADGVAAFVHHHGQPPRVFACDDAVVAVGDSARAATLALTFAQDGALVEQLTEAFGGVRHMDERARRFIETWEVEAYRKKVSAGA